MAVETQAVQISINVVDNNSAAAIGQVEKNLQGMGAAGTRAGLGVRQGFDQVGAGAISATEKTRLAAEEMGVRLPRAMISLISQSKLAAAALEAVTGAMIALATIQISFMIFGALYEGAKKLYEKWLDVNGAIQRYNDKAAEAAQQDFDKSRTLKQLNADLATATTEIDEFNRRKEVAQKWEGTTWSEFFRDLKSAAISIATLGTTPYKYHFSVADANALNALTGQSDIEKAGIEEKRHEKALREIRDNALVAESKVQGIDKARLVQKAADDEALEDTKNKFNVQNQLAAVSERAGKQPGQIGYVPRPGPHYFDEEQNDAYAHAAAEFQASVNSQRQSGGKGAGDNTAREIRRLQEEADEATLRGIDKLEYERKAADADWVSEHGRSAVAIAAIDKKYYAEESKLLDEQKKKIVDMLGAAAEGGEKILEEQARFEKRVDEMAAQSSTRGLSGFARIQADMQAQLVRFNEEAQEGHAAPSDISRGQGAIRSEAAQQSGDLARRNAEETEQLEAQARSKLLSAEKQKTAAIDTEYRERLQKFRDELAAQEISQSDYDRRVAAAAQLRDAEMVEAAREAREKMAGEFNSFFKSLDHPVKALADLGDKVAGQAAAALMQRMQTHFGGPGAATKTPGGMLGGVFDKIAGAPKASALPGASHDAIGETGSKTISLATAQIHIGSASISTSGAGGGWSGSPGGGGWSGAGSTGGYGGGAGGAGQDEGGSGSPSAGPSGSSAGSPAAGVYRAGGTTGAVVGGVEQGMGLFQQGAAMFTRAGAGGGGAATGAAGAGAAALAGGAAGSLGKLSGGNAGMLGGGGIMANAGGAVGAAGASGGWQQNADGTWVNPSMYYGPNGAGGPNGPKFLKSGAGGSNAGMLGGGGIMANAGGAVGGGLGLFNAFEGEGGIGGALSGAMSGMQLGMSLGGPIGGAIGAAGGALMGMIGFGGKEKARVYWLKTLWPRIVQDTLGYQQGTMDYSSAYSDMENVDSEGRKALEAQGHAGKDYYWGTAHPAIVQAEGKLTAEQRAGRSNYTPGTAQFASGSDSISRTGLAVLHERERVIPSDQNERITRALEGSADSSTRPASSGFGGDVHLHVSAIDARGVAQFFDQNKHLMRAKLNASFGENSGGADAY